MSVRSALPGSPVEGVEELQVPESLNQAPGSVAKERNGSDGKRAAEKNERGMVAIPLSRDSEPGPGYGAVYVPLS